VNVRVEEGVHIEHPEAMEVGDDVAFMRGFYMIDAPGLCRIGSHVRFYPNCFIQGSSRLIVADHVDFFPGTYISMGSDPARNYVQIAHHCHFAPGCILYGWGGLEIGPYCNIAAHCVLATVGHDYRIKDKPMSMGSQAAPIVLEEDVWLCANVTVTAGVRIAKGCVIGANAVVTKDTEPMGLYVGVPARRLRDRFA
jgi:acetyltransferase-like isoleucine patch superfamily enzyme